MNKIFNDIIDSVEKTQANISRDKITGIVFFEEYVKLGTDEMHRIGGPALIERSLITGNVTHEQYWVNDQLHREDGPAAIMIDQFSQVVWREGYWKNGEMHRLDGPASIWRNRETGQITEQEYWVSGKQLISGSPAYKKQFR